MHSESRVDRRDCLPEDGAWWHWHLQFIEHRHLLVGAAALLGVVEGVWELVVVLEAVHDEIACDRLCNVNSDYWGRVVVLLN